MMYHTGKTQNITGKEKSTHGGIYILLVFCVFRLCSDTALSLALLVPGLALSKSGFVGSRVFQKRGRYITSPNKTGNKLTGAKPRGAKTPTGKKARQVAKDLRERARCSA